MTTRRMLSTLALVAALAAPAIIQAQAASQAPAPPAAIGTTDLGAGAMITTGAITRDQLDAANAAAPVLSDAVKSQIVIAAQAARIAELEAQRAISELEKFRAALQQVIGAHTPAGYQLNDKLELVKLPEPKKEPGKP